MHCHTHLVCCSYFKRGLVCINFTVQSHRKYVNILERLCGVCIDQQQIIKVLGEVTTSASNLSRQKQSKEQDNCNKVDFYWNIHILLLKQ